MTQNFSAGNVFGGAVSVFDQQINRGHRINPGNSSLIADGTTRMTGSMFGAAIDANLWTAASNGAGAAAAIGSAATAGIVLLTSGTANNGYGSLITTQHARFLFVMPNLFRMACRLTATAVTGCTRRWGACDITAGNPPTLNNGYYFSHDGAGALTVNCKVAGVAAVSVSSGSFNGAVASYTVDNNVHAYEILYFVMGVWFFIDGVLIHKFSPTTLTLNNDLDVHCFAQSVNSSTNSGVLEVWASSIYRLGKLETNPTYKNISGNAATWVIKQGAGILRKLIFNNTSGTSFILYDNTSAAAPIIGTFTTAAGIIGSQAWDVPFQTGLTIVTTGNGLDMTVLYE
jgi:hypothetical protein